MKAIILALLGLISTGALACPQINGVFTGDSISEENVQNVRIRVQTETNNAGQTVYVIDQQMGEFAKPQMTVVADNKHREVESTRPDLRTSYLVKCEGDKSFTLYEGVRASIDDGVISISKSVFIKVGNDGLNVNEDHRVNMGGGLQSLKSFAHMQAVEI